METKRRRPGDVASGVETVLRGVEVILPIRRHRRSFRRAHGCTPYLTQPRPARHIYIIKQDIRIYVPYSRPNGWTDCAEIFC